MGGVGGGVGREWGGSGRGGSSGGWGGWGGFPSNIGFYFMHCLSSKSILLPSFDTQTLGHTFLQ